MWRIKMQDPRCRMHDCLVIPRTVVREITINEITQIWLSVRSVLAPLHYHLCVFAALREIFLLGSSLCAVLHALCFFGTRIHDSVSREENSS